MNITSKFKETVTSVLPVMLIVFFLGLTAAPLEKALLLRFFIGGILLILGLTIFLLGVDIGIQPMGEQTGSALVSKRNLLLLLGVSFVIGFLVTIAEPDIQVFADQIHDVFSAVNKTALVYIIACGVGIFIVFGLLRTILKWSLKIVLTLMYALLFLLAYFAPENFRGIAFDSGGATTGPMTVPFILALGMGVSSVRSSGSDKDSDSFGLTGITSIGPVAAVLAYGIFLSASGNLNHASELASETAEASGLGIFIHLIPEVTFEALCSILPVVILFIIFQIFLLHLPPKKVARIAVGLVYSFIGLSIFLIGVNGGFMDAGRNLGTILGEKARISGGIWNFLLIFTGLILGAVVVCAEPAVWVLTEQVENLSGGTIKRKLMITFLAAGSSAAIALAMWKALSGFSLMRIILPGYLIALVLLAFCPKLFTAIAFDSGGVASGPITSTFVLSFTLGASKATGGSADPFGVIALVAMTPLIAIQVLGIIFAAKKKKNKIVTKEAD